MLGRLKSTIPNLQIYLPKKANCEKLGLGIDNPCRIVFLILLMNKCLERVNDLHFWNLGVFSYAMIPRYRPNSRLFLHHRQIYIVYVYGYIDVLVKTSILSNVVNTISNGSNACLSLTSDLFFFF